MSGDLVKRESLAEDKMLDGSNRPRTLTQEVGFPIRHESESPHLFYLTSHFWLTSCVCWKLRHLKISLPEHESMVGQVWSLYWFQIMRPISWQGREQKHCLVNMFMFAVWQGSYKRCVLLTLEDQEEKSFKSFHLAYSNSHRFKHWVAVFCLFLTIFVTKLGWGVEDTHRCLNPHWLWLRTRGRTCLSICSPAPKNTLLHCYSERDKNWWRNQKKNLIQSTHEETLPS